MISISIKNMAGDIVTIDVDPKSTVFYLKQVYGDHSDQKYSTFYDDLSLFIDDEEKVTELCPNEKRIDRCGVRNGMCLFAIYRGLAPISHLMSTIQCPLDDNGFGLKIEKLDSRSYEISPSQFIMKHACMYQCFTEPIECENLYFSVDAKFNIINDFTTPHNVGKYGCVWIGDACYNFTNSFVACYNKPMKYLSIMKHEINNEGKKVATIKFSCNHKEDMKMLFGHYHMNGGGGEVSYVVRESTRSEISKIDNLILEKRKGWQTVTDKLLKRNQ